MTGVQWFVAVFWLSVITYAIVRYAIHRRRMRQIKEESYKFAQDTLKRMNAMSEDFDKRRTEIDERLKNSTKRTTRRRAD
jgi:cytochrome c oxidase assembly factor CtaG